jgi:hypothetical protein
MSIADRDFYVRQAASAMLAGKPLESLADWAAAERAKEEAAKVVDLASWRARLRPVDKDHGCP